MKMDIKKGISITRDVKNLAYNSKMNLASEAELLAYLGNLKFDYVKFIQVIMYLGREESGRETLNGSERELFLQYFNEIYKNKNWNDKDSEIIHIISKKQYLSDYLEKGLSFIKGIQFEDNSAEKNEEIKECVDVAMNNYYRLKRCASVESLNKYLEHGWELIGNERALSNYGEYNIIYHIGYPITCHIAELKKIIKKYEELGLFEELKYQLFAAENIAPDTIRVSKSDDDYFWDKGDSEALDFLNTYKRVMGEKEKFSTKKSWEF